MHADPAALQRALGIPQARAAIVVLVDGLGYWNLAMRLAHANYLRALMKEPVNQRPISTCAPSTTTAAMATFGTALRRGRRVAVVRSRHEIQQGVQVWDVYAHAFHDAAVDGRALNSAAS